MFNWLLAKFTSDYSLCNKYMLKNIKVKIIYNYFSLKLLLLIYLILFFLFKLLKIKFLNKIYLNCTSVDCVVLNVKILSSRYRIRSTNIFLRRIFCLLIFNPVLLQKKVYAYI